MVQYLNDMSELLSIVDRQLTSGRQKAHTHHIKVEDLKHGDYFQTGPDTPIFGVVYEHTEYPEDSHSIAMARDNGYIFGMCYSILCPEGELGDTHVTYIERKLTEAEFEQAKASGWVTQ